MPLPTIDIAVEAGDWPPEDQLCELSERAVAAVTRAFPPPQTGRASAVDRLDAAELSILFTDDATIQKLNAAWRGKDSPTNVLSFPQPDGRLLGDIVLASGTVHREAALAGKPIEDHIALLIVHGLFHLLGYDHEEDSEAEEMERLETAAMGSMGLPDPYRAPEQDR